MRRFERKEQRQKEAKERAAAYKKLSSHSYVGIKEKIKHGILTKEDALVEIESWSNLCPPSRLVSWVKNYQPPKKKSKSVKKGKKNDS